MGAEIDEVVALRLERSLSAQSLVKTGYLRRLVGELKAPIAVSWIARAHAAGEVVVVFCEHQPVLLRIVAGCKARRIPVGVIDGSVPKAKRTASIAAFERGDLPVMICSTAAKEGITLVKARHVLLAERFFNAATEDQMVDRLHRIGQTRQVTVWLLHAAGTYDENLAAMVRRKRKIAGRALNAEAASRG